MKSRPRRAENRTAEELNKWFNSKGFSDIKRIPVLGRVGPDYTTNELGLVIDNKSRKQVPKLYQINKPVVIKSGDLYGVRLKEIDLLFSSEYEERNRSIVVERWFQHMDNWRKDEFPNGITALVLHYPGRNVSSSTLVVKEKEELYERIAGYVRSQ